MRPASLLNLSLSPPSLLILLFTIISMIHQTHSLANNVAILGSGIAASTAARHLAESNLVSSITVFEAGFGVGGRTSTRTTRDENQLQFDHGAQYIGAPKTDIFKKELQKWEDGGFAREWTGRFVDVSLEKNDVSLKKEEAGKGRKMVGYPSMNSICQNLLKHDKINVVTQTRACATHDGKCWKLHAHGDETKKLLGNFDWLIGSDRLSGTNNRADLRDVSLPSFKSAVNSIKNVPSLVLMVAFESPLDIDLDGMNFINSEDSKDWGSLAWAARDTSKPGRERSDGKECWVVQSVPNVAEEIIAQVAAEGGSFEESRAGVREKATDLLLNDFCKAVITVRGKEGENGYDLPNVVSAVGHRWSAAFPNVPSSLLWEEVGKKDDTSEYFTDTEQKFVACGDYMGRYTGRIEGAYLSGKKAADFVLDAVQEESTK